MPSFDFIFLADCQLGCYATFSGSTPDEIERFAARGLKVMAVAKTDSFEWDAARYREAIAAANRRRPAFVVLGGDMIDDPTRADQLDAFQEITADLHPSIPLYFVPGNHDIATNTVVPTPESIAWYRDTFATDFYAFVHEDVAFVVLDSSLIQRPEKAPEAYAAQMAFLDGALDDARAGRRTVVFSHHPPFLREPDEPDTYWNLPLERRGPLLARLRESGVRLILSGHLHRNNHAQAGDLDVVTSGAVGFPLGDDPPGYRVVEVRDDRIDHTYHALEDEP